MRRPSVWCWVAVWSLGCAGGGAQQRVVHAVESGQYTAALRAYEADGHDPSTLRSFAESSLERAAVSRDAAQSRAALNELALLGPRAEPLLERIADRAEVPVVRADAMRMRMALGAGSARSQLRALLSSPDADVVDQAYAALDPGEDAAMLERALNEPRAQRRTTALQLLSRSAPTRLALVERVSRDDPEAALRAAAARELGRYGRAALPALELALRDKDEQVRLAAIDALGRLASASEPEPAALALLDQQLGAASTPVSLGAARALLRLRPAREPARAWAAWLTALTAADAGLRARAASALPARPIPEPPRSTVYERLRSEPVHSVKLLLALAIGPDDPEARAALTQLAASASVTGAQAAAALWPHDRAQHARLRNLRSHPAAIVRATAARLLGRELHDCRSVAKLLADALWSVRLAAAGAALSCS